MIQEVKARLELTNSSEEQVDKIREKLKELEEKEKQELKGLKGQDRYFVKQLYDTKINLLNELLE